MRGSRSERARLAHCNERRQRPATPQEKMYFVYILISEKDNRTYTGYSKDVEVRLKLHNSGQVGATKNRRPFKVLFTEMFQTKKETKERELWWKSSSGRNKLKEFFSNPNKYCI